MKAEWICSWQYIPGREKHFEVYATLDEACHAMAKVLADGIDLSGYIHALRNEEGEDCGSSADFLERFLSDLVMPETENDLPDHYDIPEHCLLEFDSCDGFRWGYMREECPYLSVGHVYEGKEIEPYVISFNYDSPKSIRRDRVNAVEIRITKHINYGTSANPLMVYLSLGKKPATQTQIARRISENWDVPINRKAVGRHLQLLRNLGYPVQHDLDGYYYEGDAGDPDPAVKFTPSAYPLLILQVLNDTPKTQTAIIKEIQKKFGTKIDRKAVVRDLALLKAFGFDLQRYNSGYYIGK